MRKELKRCQDKKMNSYNKIIKKWRMRKWIIDNKWNICKEKVSTIFIYTKKYLKIIELSVSVEFVGKNSIKLTFDLYFPFRIFQSLNSRSIFLEFLSMKQFNSDHRSVATRWELCGKSLEWWFKILRLLKWKR